jgi:hypothetical protein
MKFREVKERESRTRLLEVSLSRRDVIRPDMAHRIMSMRDESLLDLRIPQAGAPGMRPHEAASATKVIFFDIGSLTPLERFIRQDALSSQQYENILFSVADVLTYVEAMPLPSSCVQFDWRYVYALTSGNLRFAALPLIWPKQVLGHPGPHDLLARLARAANVRFMSEDDVARAEHLQAFLKQEKGLDTHRYQDFLEHEYGAWAGGMAGHSHAEAQAHAHGDVQAHAEAQAHAGQTILRAGFAHKGPRALSARSYVQAYAQSSAQAGENNIPKTVLLGTAAPSHDPAPQPDKGCDGAALGSAVAGEAEAAVRSGVDAAPLAPVSQTAFWLVRVNTQERYALDEDVEDVLGRSSACDIQLLGNMSLSRMHASLTCGNDGIQIVDLGSENGVVVKGVELEENQYAELSVGEIFYLGDEPFYVECKD